MKNGTEEMELSPSPPPPLPQRGSPGSRVGIGFLLGSLFLGIVLGAASILVFKKSLIANEPQVLTELFEPSDRYFALDEAHDKPAAAVLRSVTDSAADGDVESQYFLARSMIFGFGSSVDFTNAFRWLTNGAALNYGPSQYLLGMRYLHGSGVEKDEARASALMLSSAESGYLPAEYAIGYMLTFGTAGEKDLSKGLSWLKRAAEGGYVEAQIKFGDYMIRNGTTEQEKQEGLDTLLLASEQGSSRARFFVGKAYESGALGQRDLKEARKWMQLSALYGFDPAIRWIEKNR